MEKKVWIKPKLVVLFRGRPEEAVLQSCKYNGMSGPQLNNCNRLEGYSIQPCETKGSS
ncbi:MAG: hypothetical protein SVY10_09350 [Thermodesulfobacteriota bacterium]|nr:hypothetical protein [Thermodesulfobacteriota bacterium]